MPDLTCKDCTKPLKGGVDTFGTLGNERCWPCQSAYVRKRRIRDGLDYPPEYVEDVDVSIFVAAQKRT